MPKVGSTIIRTLTTPLLLAVLVLSASVFVQAETSDVTFVVVKNEGVYKKIISATEQSLADRGIEIDKHIVETQSAKPAKADGQIISIGTKSAAFAYQQYPDQAITNALITRSSFQQLAQDHFDSTENAAAHKITPLFIDQPITRFFSLGLELVPNARTIGVLVGPSNKAQIPTIEAKAKALGLSINIALLEPDSNPIKIIEPVMRNSDFFVVLPDRKLINQLAAKWTLPLSYRYRKPIIAYSHKYVDAGALASVFTSPEDVASAIAQQLTNESSKGTGNQNNTPYFSISLNRSVARSLRIQLQQPEYYQQRLQAKGVTKP